MVNLELVGDKNHEFALPSDALAITRARIIECRFDSLSSLHLFTNLVSLEIFNYPDATLEHLRPLRHLEQLRIHHMPGITNLEPLSGLVALKRLILETRPSWDSSGKVTEVDSLAPLRDLPALEEVNLFGVRPKSKAVDDLLAIPTLRKARVSKFAKAEIARLNNAVPNEWVAWQ